MGTLRHVTLNIEKALSFSDDELQDMFDGKGSEIRAELLERKANGELLVGSDGCEGFNSINGCPGHETN